MFRAVRHSWTALSPRPAVGPRSGYSLVELLVVVAIVGVLAGILLPAVQKVREAANRAKCTNHLKQIALATSAYHDAKGKFPTGGADWFSTLTLVNGLPADPPKQGLGWGYQLLPFVGQEAVYKNTVYHEVKAVPVSTYFCPSRRAPVVVDSGMAPRGLNDYCGVTGRGGEHYASGPYHGIIVRNVAGVVRVANVTDGLSNTMMFAEKRLNSTRYQLGDWHDDQGYTSGWDADIVRLTNYPWGRDAPHGVNGFEFGSAHPIGMNAAFGDGSVRIIRYTAPTVLLDALGDRRDGSVVNLNSL